MITDIDTHASLYVLAPFTPQGSIVEVGGLAVMEELSDYITDEDIFAITGMSNDRCLIMVKKDASECMECVRKAKESLDKKLLEVQK